MMDRPGKCRGCGSTEYTRRELNLHPDQHWRCYACLAKQRVEANNLTGAPIQPIFVGVDMASQPDLFAIRPVNPYARMVEFGVPTP